MASVSEVELQGHLCVHVARDSYCSFAFLFKIKYVPDTAKKWQQHLVNIFSDALLEMFMFCS